MPLGVVRAADSGGNVSIASGLLAGEEDVGPDCL